MQAVILCGGRGTRLHEETSLRPKPMVPIGGHPILWHITPLSSLWPGISSCALVQRGRHPRLSIFNTTNADVEVDLSSGDVTLLSGDDIDWRVRLVDTGMDAMTGARIRRIGRHIGSDRFFATYGDGLANIDLDRLLHFHTQQGKKVTVTAVRPPSRYGELLVDGALVRSFAEKPQTGAGWINGGFFVFERAALKDFPDHEDLSLEATVLEQMAADGHGSVQARRLWQHGHIP